MVRAGPHLDGPGRRAGRGAGTPHGRVGRRGGGLGSPGDTPAGVAMHGSAADVKGDGVLTFADLTAFSAVYNGGTALRPGDTGYDPDADLSGSGSMGFFDYTAFTGRYGAYAPGGSNPTFNAGWIDNPGDPNGPDNSIGYDGYVFDLAGATESTSTGLYMVRHRVYDPKLGRWLERDPMGYVNGLNLLQYVASNSLKLLDPEGRAYVCVGVGAGVTAFMPAPTVLAGTGVSFSSSCYWCAGFGSAGFKCTKCCTMSTTIMLGAGVWVSAGGSFTFVFDTNPAPVHPGVGIGGGVGGGAGLGPPYISSPLLVPEVTVDVDSNGAVTVNLGRGGISLGVYTAVRVNISCTGCGSNRQIAAQMAGCVTAAIAAAKAALAGGPAPAPSVNPNRWFIETIGN